MSGRAKTVTVSLQPNGNGYTVGPQNTAAVTIGPDLGTPTGPVGRARPRQTPTGGTPRLSIRSVSGKTQEGQPAQFVVEVDRDLDQNIAYRGGDRRERDRQRRHRARRQDHVSRGRPAGAAEHPDGGRRRVRGRRGAAGDDRRRRHLRPRRQPDREHGHLVGRAPRGDDHGHGHRGRGWKGHARVERKRRWWRRAGAVDDRGHRDVWLSTSCPITPVVTLNSGSSATIDVQTLTDTIIEPDETIVVSIGQSPNYKVGKISSAVITIQGASGDAAKPVLTLSPLTTSVDRGQPDPVQPRREQLGRGRRRAAAAVQRHRVGRHRLPASRRPPRASRRTVVDDCLGADRAGRSGRERRGGVGVARAERQVPHRQPVRRFGDHRLRGSARAAARRRHDAGHRRHRVTTRDRRRPRTRRRTRRSTTRCKAVRSPGRTSNRSPAPSCCTPGRRRSASRC